MPLLTSFPEIGIYDLDRSRLISRDPLGLSTWDTNGGLDDGCKLTSLPPMKVQRSANLQPIAALQACVALDRIGWYCMDVLGAGLNTPATPEIIYELRIGLGGATSITVQGTILKQAQGGVRGRMVQLAGLLATRWEMWMRVPTTEDNDCTIRLRAILDRVGNAASVVDAGAANAGRVNAINGTIGTITLIQ